MLKIDLDHNMIVAAKRVDSPRSGITASGYGSKLATDKMIQLDNRRWYRVYAVCYSNVASCYIVTKHAGKRWIGLESEIRIETLLQK